MHHAIAILCLLSTLLCAQQATPFSCDIRCSNAQVDKLVIACHPQATDGPDAKLDIPVPPFGINSATVTLRPASPEQPALYQDTRSLKLPQTWHLDIRNSTRKPVRLTWNRNALPQGITFMLQRPDGQLLNMKRLPACTLSGDATVTIHATAENAPAKP